MKNLIILMYYINVEGLTKVQYNQKIYEHISHNEISEDIQNMLNVQIIKEFIPVTKQPTKVECIYSNINTSTDVNKLISTINKQVETYTKEPTNENRIIRFFKSLIKIK